MKRILCAGLIAAMPALLAAPAAAQDHPQKRDLLQEAIELSLKSSELAAAGKAEAARELAAKASALLQEYTKLEAKKVAHERQVVVEFDRRKAEKELRAAQQEHRAAQKEHRAAAKEAQAAEAERRIRLRLRDARENAEFPAHAEHGEYRVLGELFERGDYPEGGEELDRVHQFFAPGARLRYRAEHEAGSPEHDALLEWIDAEQLTELHQLPHDELEIHGRFHLREGEDAGAFQLLHGDELLELGEFEVQQWLQQGGCAEGEGGEVEFDYFFHPQEAPAAPLAIDEVYEMHFDDLFDPQEAPIAPLPLREVIEGRLVPGLKGSFELLELAPEADRVAPHGPLFQGAAPKDYWIENTEGGGQQVQIFIAPEIRMDGDGRVLQLKAHAKKDAALAPNPFSQRKVIVQKGDSLASISEEHLGGRDYVLQIAELNELHDPRELRVGQELRLPGKEVHVHTQRLHAEHAAEAKAKISQMQAELQALREELRALREAVTARRQAH